MASKSMIAAPLKGAVMNRKSVAYTGVGLAARHRLATASLRWGQLTEGAYRRLIEAQLKAGRNILDTEIRNLPVPD